MRINQLVILLTQLVWMSKQGKALHCKWVSHTKGRGFDLQSGRGALRQGSLEWTHYALTTTVAVCEMSEGLLYPCIYSKGKLWKTIKGVWNAGHFKKPKECKCAFQKDEKKICQSSDFEVMNSMHNLSPFMFWTTIPIGHSWGSQLRGLRGGEAWNIEGTRLEMEILIIMAVWLILVIRKCILGPGQWNIVVLESCGRLFPWCCWKTCFCLSQNSQGQDASFSKLPQYSVTLK